MRSRWQRSRRRILYSSSNDCAILSSSSTASAAEPAAAAEQQPLCYTAQRSTDARTKFFSPSARNFSNN